MAFKTDGERCMRNPVQDNDIPHHLHFCTLHNRTYATRFARNNQVHHRPGKCVLATTAGTWCTHDAGDTGRCDYHTRVHTRREARAREIQQRVTRILQAVHTLEARHPLPSWREVVRELYGNLGGPLHVAATERYEVADLYFRRNRVGDDRFIGTILVLRYANWVRGGQVGPEPVAGLPLAPPPPPRVTTLAALAQDGQNVHRTVVSDQTNRSTELLLATPDVAEHCRAHELLAAVWLDRRIASWPNVRRTVDDIVSWRSKDTCRTENDRLYRRLLHALFMRIYRMTDTATRYELWRRFYEECSEAVGLCCEGHISRLCNVLVGFDDAFKPPVPLGELLQARMSAISEMDVPDQDKIKLATEFFNEHNVPDDQRAAWIEAF